MKRLLFGLGVLAIVAYFAWSSLDPVQVAQREERGEYAAEQHRLELERQRLELEQQRAEVARQQQIAAATLPAQTGASFTLWVLLPASALVLLYITLDAYQQRRRPLVYPNAAGYLPVTRQLVDQGDRELVQLLATAIRRHGEAWVMEAIHQPGQTPASLTYAPHSARNQLAAETDESEHTVASSVPTFGDLLAQNRVGPGKPLLLGYDTESGQEIIGAWLDLYSTIVSGIPGTGKTTSQRFLACQTALHGAQFVICDPHAGAADDSLAATLAPLESVFLCEPAANDRSILEAVRLVADIGKKRIDGRDESTQPLILWLDETTSLLARSTIGDALAELLERIAQEYRKKRIFCCASGQIWTAARAGGSEVRDSFASVICHRMKRSQARLLLPTGEAAQVERLSTGQAVLWRTSGATNVVTIPNTTAADVRTVGNLLANTESVKPRLISQELVKNQPQVSQATPFDYSAPQQHESLSPEATRIVALFLDGMDAGAIVTDLTGMTSKAGKPYITRLIEVQAVIRQALRGQRAAA